MIKLRVCLLGILLLVAGCGDNGVAFVPQPREPDSHAIGYYCRMMLTEHAGPKGQILLKGASDLLWFSSMREGVARAAIAACLEVAIERAKARIDRDPAR